MKKVRKLLTGIAMAIVAVAFASCNSISQADAYNGRVDYMEGLNYFFNTNAPKKVPEKITSQRMFDKYFSLQNMYAKTPDLTLNYGVKVGAVRTYTTQPSRVVIVSKRFKNYKIHKARK